MALVAEVCETGCLPHVLVTGQHQTVLIRSLEEHHHQTLIDRYLAFQPRNCFQGLPPLRDEVCAQWVRGMIEGGINLEAVLYRNEEVVGHAVLMPESTAASELLVVVWGPYQNGGIGTQLVRCSLGLSRQLGLRQLGLCVEARNVHARHVYEKCGFQYLTHHCAGEVKMARRV
jgi:diamine N-acetyltransferase